MRRLLAISAISLTYTACSGTSGEAPESRGVVVPEARLASAEARERGRALYAEHCALCHGPRADGKGARREGLSSRPRDFTDPAWRARTSPREVFVAVRDGVRSTAMPSWRALGDEDIWDLVAYLRSVAETLPPGAPLPSPRPTS
jgi:mono/diheme cytochrome c family protein